MNIFKIQILSSLNDKKFMSIILNNLNKEGIKLDLLFVDDFDFGIESFYLLGVKGLQDKKIDIVANKNSELKGKVVVYSNSNDALLGTTLARLGISNIFILPQELQKLKAFFNSAIQKYLHDLNTSIMEDNEVNFEIFENYKGSSSQTINLIEQAKRVTLNPSVNAIIYGETGTGKGLLAQCIHNASSRRKKPFVDINCAAIPQHLLESELFGYERGAFTDAKITKIGLLELGNDGTIFLDEIGDMGLEIQAKLLRAIDNKVIRRLGGTADIKISGRILAATNKSLTKLIEKKLFREDLYHRLNVITLKISALRERDDDKILLANIFNKELSERFGNKPLLFNDDVIEFIKSYEWPGNVRELRNAIERGILLADSPNLKIEQMFLRSDRVIEEVNESEIERFDFKINYTSLELLTKNYVLQALKKCNGNKTKTAELLQISRPRLDRIIQK